jgi:sarcosine oxidase subunit gamma
MSKVEVRRANEAASRPTTVRRSPIESWLCAQGAEWDTLGNGAVATRVAAPDVEAARLAAVGLCDFSGLVKLGIKGLGAADWLRQQGVDVPAEVYAGVALADGGLLVRTGGGEFFYESGGSGTEPILRRENIPVPIFVERQDATLLLCGPRTLEVLAQTCGVEVAAAPPRRLIYTRVAGVSCGLWPDAISGLPACRLWVDPSFALGLWESLVEIAEELGGGAVGTAALQAGGAR